MAIEIRPVNPHFVAGIGGIDLSKSVDRPVVAAISEAIDRYAVVVFRDQRLDDTQLRDFASKFGALEIGRGAARGGRRRLAHPEIGDISNLDEDGRLRQRDDRRRLDGLGNWLWHPPRSLAARTYTNIRRWSVMPHGGHFAALEQPDALANEVREFFRPLRS